MKKILTITTVILSLTLTAQTFPRSFKVDQDVLSFGSDFTLSGGLGTVKERIISMTPSFSYYSTSGAKIASASEAIKQSGIKEKIIKFLK